MTLQEMLQRFENSLLKDHINKIRKERGIPKVDVDQFIKDTEEFTKRMSKLKKY